MRLIVELNSARNRAQSVIISKRRHVRLKQKQQHLHAVFLLKETDWKDYVVLRRWIYKCNKNSPIRNLTNATVRSSEQSTHQFQKEVNTDICTSGSIVADNLRTLKYFSTTNHQSVYFVVETRQFWRTDQLTYSIGTFLFSQDLTSWPISSVSFVLFCFSNINKPT